MVSFYLRLLQCLWFTQAPESECVNEHDLAPMRSCFLLPTASGGLWVACRLVWVSEEPLTIQVQGEGGKERWKDQIESLKAAHHIIGISRCNQRRYHAV